MLLSVSLYALLNLVGFSEKPPLKIKQWVSAFGPLRLVNFSMDCVLMSLHLFDIFSAALVVCLGLLCNETWMAQSTQVRNKRKPKKKNPGAQTSRVTLQQLKQKNACGAEVARLDGCPAKHPNIDSLPGGVPLSIH